MRSAYALGILALASGFVHAQVETITLPWANGDTVVVSEGTNALGDPTTRTLSTLNGAAGATQPTQTTTTPANPANGNANGRPTTTGPRVVGVDNTAPPMRTTTYWYDPGDGVWVSQVWQASVTAAPSVATAVVPEGTIQNYNSYQNVINSAVFKSAAAAEMSASGGSIQGNIGTGAAARSVREGAAAMFAVAVGAIGAGLGVLAL